jgi:ketosteroid isomerase-like protein
LSLNKGTVQKYIDGFNKSNHEQILSCLTDDIEWHMPNAFRLTGKDAIDKEIENDAFTGPPVVKITRMIEEDDIVIAEGTVRVAGRAAVSLMHCSVMYLKWRTARSSA